MGNDMFDELKNIKTKLKTEEKETQEKKESEQKNKRESDLKNMFETYMKDVKVKK